MWNLVSYNDRVCCCFILFEWLLLLLLLPEPIIPVAKLRYKTDRPIYWWCDSRAINRQTDCQNQIIILIGYLYVFLVCVCVIFAYSVLVAIASNSYWIDIAGVLLLSKLLFQRQEESLMHHCSLMVPFDLRLNLFHLSIRLCLVSMKSSTWLFGNGAIRRRKKTVSLLWLVNQVDPICAIHQAKRLFFSSIPSSSIIITYCAWMILCPISSWINM